MNGFVIIDKPCGITSSACVYKLRKIITDKKIGHCGTLDPLASGLLPISIGEATKFSSYISDLSKEYKVEVLFGVYIGRETLRIRAQTKTGMIFSFHSSETLKQLH